MLSRARQQQATERAKQGQHDSATNRSEQAAKQASQAEKSGLNSSLEINEAEQTEHRVTGGSYRAWPWWFIGTALMSLAFTLMFQIVNAPAIAWLPDLIVLAAATLFLAYMRPIDWRIAVILVTLLHALNSVVLVAIKGVEDGASLGYYLVADNPITPISLFLVPYVVNVALVAYITKERRRHIGPVR